MLSTLLHDSKYFLTLVLTSILISIADIYGILNTPKGVLQNITIPIQFGLYKTSTSIGRQLEFIALSRKAAQEYKAQTEQLASVLSENANLRRQLSEAQGFMDQTKALSPLSFNTVAARPIGINRYLLIDKGSDDGLMVNQVVVYKDNYIGKVIQAGNKKSQVLLLTDPDSKLASFVSSGGGKAKGILQGQFGSEMVLEKILHRESINKDDLVYSEGSEQEIPRGLILGQVADVLVRDNEIFKSAKVKTVFDVTSLDIVFVITN